MAEDLTIEGGLVRVRPRRHQKWSAGSKAAFLDVLAATGSVPRAAEAVGRTDHAAQALRRRDEAFAAEWRRALDTASDTLQAAVIEHALGDRRSYGVVHEAGSGPAPVPCPTCGAGGERPFDPDLALRVLANRATRAAAPKFVPPSNYRQVPIAEVEASLMKKIAAIVAWRKPA